MQHLIHAYGAVLMSESRLSEIDWAYWRAWTFDDRLILSQLTKTDKEGPNTNIAKNGIIVGSLIFMLIHDRNWTVPIPITIPPANNAGMMYTIESLLPYKNA